MGPLSSTFGFVKPFVQAGALLLGCATLVAVGCSGRTDRPSSNESAGGASAGQGGESAGGSGTGEACDLSDDESCRAGETRCCTGPTGDTCVPIDWDNCTGCNERCDLLVSNSCADGTCVCGDEPACSGKTPFCVQGTCVECIGNSDCFDSMGVGARCFQGACVECDPRDPAACSGERLACSPDGECVPCSEKQSCPGTLYCDLESGHCKVCVEDYQCPDPVNPICVEYTDKLSECQPCTSDEQCAGRDPERGQCVTEGFGTGQCYPCDPRDDGGCDEDAECHFSLEVPNVENYECRGCVADADCDDLTTPLCDVEAHTCVPCNDPSIELPHYGCATKGAWVCITAGEHAGECGNCDPASDTGCNMAAAPRCDADSICRECLETEDCREGFECSPNHECIGCTSDEQCEESSTGTQCVDVTGGKGCRWCDPSDNAGCEPQQKCLGGFTCSNP